MYDNGVFILFDTFTLHPMLDIAEGMVSSGLAKVGFQHIWLDDGWVVGRDNKTGMLLEDRVLFPSGMGNITSQIHGLGLKFGEYSGV